MQKLLIMKKILTRLQNISELQFTLAASLFFVLFYFYKIAMYHHKLDYAMLMAGVLSINGVIHPIKLFFKVFFKPHFLSSFSQSDQIIIGLGVLTLLIFSAEQLISVLKF